MKTGLLVVERLLIVCLVACVGVFVWRKFKPPVERFYKFRGEFCGIELWEYSATGAAQTIWVDWQTNVNEDGILIRPVVKTNTFEEYLRQQQR